MLLLAAATDKIEAVTDAAVTVDAHASFMDMTNADPPAVKGSTSGKQNTAITTAATTDIVAAPAGSTIRNVKTINIANKSAATPVGVTVRYNQNGTSFTLFKATLNGGDVLQYFEGVGWFVIAANKLFVNKRVTADVVNATVSFADVTGLTSPVLAGHQYNFEAHLIHVCNATTTGARYGINGPAMTAMIVSTISTVTGSVTASVHSAGTVAALDTAAAAETTGPATQVLAILSGWINPSADGTFAIRHASEVAVAAGLTTKAGSWLQLWETDN